MLNIKSFSFNPFEERCSVAWDEEGTALIVDPGCYFKEEFAELENFITGNNLRPVYIMLTHAHFDHIFGVSYFASKWNLPVVMDAIDKVIIDNNKYFCMNFGLLLPDNTFAEGEWKEYNQEKAQKPAERSTQEPSEPQNCDGQGGGKSREEREGQWKPLVLTVKEGDVVEWGNGRKWEVISTPGHTPGEICFLDREAKLLMSGDTLFAGSIGRTDNKWGDYDALINSIFTKLMVLDGDISVIPGHGGPTTIADERTKNPFLQPFNEEYLVDE